MATCRVCSSVVGRTHCVTFFSPEMTKCNLASRMSKLLEVPICQEDTLSKFVCRSCKTKFISVESKLESLRTLAKSSYQVQSGPEQQSSRKRTKDTSGDNASPSTVKARPASKRGIGRAKTLFPAEICKKNHLKCI